MPAVTSARGLGTKLASSSAFKAQFKKLQVDNSTGLMRAGVPVPVPAEFHGERRWAGYLAPRQQGSCGSCWAFAVSEALAARIAIYTRGRTRPTLSVGNLVVCNLGADVETKAAVDGLTAGSSYDYTGKSERVGKSSVEDDEAKHVGCDGETLLNAWAYTYRFGVVEDSCVPYTNLRAFEGDTKLYDISRWGDDPQLPLCYATMGLSYDLCSADPKRAAKYYRAGGYYIVPGVASQDPSASERTIRTEIYKFGPVSTGFLVHDDFMAWDGKGVYSYDGTSAEQGGHAVLVVGWGRDEALGKDYWVCMNSWGADWGESGFFRIQRGTNECQIEENVVVGFPDMPQIRLYLDWPVYYTADDYTLRTMWRVMDSGYKQTVYERILSGELPRSAVPEGDLDAPAVPTGYWPDFKSFIAGTSEEVSAGPLRALTSFAADHRTAAKLGALAVGIAVAAAVTFLVVRGTKKRGGRRPGARM